MTVRWVSLIILTLAFGVCCNAGVLVFSDLTEGVSLTLDGVAVTGNGGRISNFAVNGESISFDITAPEAAANASVFFTNLLDPLNSDDPPNTVSDRFTFEFISTIPLSYHVVLGSDPDLPAIPNGAVDLTTVAAQGLPANPYFEDGSAQKVGTIFTRAGAILDTYFIQSDVNDVPEPGSLLLIGTGLGLVGLVRRRLS